MLNHRHFLAYFISLLFAFLFVWGCEEPLPQIGDSCQKFEDCAQGDRLACQNNTCQQIRCQSTPECPFGSACVGGYCTIAECLNDTECTGAQICFGGACLVAGCKDNSDCPNQVCRGTPKQCLAPPAFCLNDVDCPTGKRCQNTTGQCKETCQSDDNCSVDQYCDGLFCRRRCTTDDQCTGSDLCIEQKCQSAPDCGEAACPPDKPVRDIRTCVCLECQSDNQCNMARNEACLDQECTYCPIESTSESQCLLQGLRLRQGCCVQCVVNEHCDSENGEVCQKGRCIDQSERTCLTDDQCGFEEVCDGSRCTPESSLKACTKQTDCPDGEACHGNGRCRAVSDRCQGQCQAPNRCIAEPGDTQGTCAGCTQSCTDNGCPTDSFCYVPEGQVEGYCAASLFRPMLCP